MGSVLDVFSSDAFGMVSLTEGIDKLPYVPGRIDGMGLFKTEGVFHNQVKIEERHGKLTLVPTAPRGTMEEFATERVRQARIFQVPHLPKNDFIMADDIADVRAFNSDNRTEAIGEIVADRLEQLKQDHAATWEFHMAKALSGIVLDADGSTVIYNWFTEFNIFKQTVTISKAGANSAKLGFQDIRRRVIDALGGESFTSLHGFCNQAFMDEFVVIASVKEAYDRWQDTVVQRENLAYNNVDLFGINIEEYRNVATIDTTDGTRTIDIPYIDHPDTPGDPVCYVVPIGTRNIFKRYNAPAPFVETVNTKGRDVYVKQVRNDFDTGVKLHTNSNPLIVNQRPACIVEVLLDT